MDLRHNNPAAPHASAGLHWQALLDSAGEGIWGVDLDGNCTFVNREACEIFGYRSEDVIGNNMHDLVHHHYPDGNVYPRHECNVYRVFREHTPLRRTRDTLFRSDGSCFLTELSAEPVYINGVVSGAVVTFRDITSQHQQEQNLRQMHRLAEERTAELSAVIESLPHGIHVATRDGRALSNVYGRAMFHGAYGDGLPPVLQTLHSALEGAQTAQVEQIDGRWIESTGSPIRLNGQLIGGVAVNTDVTQARLQNDALRRTEKLAAVGQLASSIAHEINNPLESITNLLYLIRESKQMDEISHYTQLAQVELARVTEITMQTLRFHRQQSKPTRIDLVDLLRTILSLYAGRLLVRNIALLWRLRPVPPVLCMEGEIRQVLNNLVRNAIDAMSSGSAAGRRGCLTLCIRPQTHATTGQPGVRVTVADTGEGVPPEIAAHLYEPFQTSKEHTGTGLGLWVSKGIVDKHGGSLRMKSRRGERHGTVFSLWLPEMPPVDLPRQTA